MDEQPGTSGIHSLGWRMTCSILVEDIGKIRKDFGLPSRCSRILFFVISLKKILVSSHEWSTIHENHFVVTT